MHSQNGLNMALIQTSFQDVKDVFVFNYMMDVMDEVNNEIISGQEALDQVELYGNASLESL